MSTKMKSETKGSALGPDWVVINGQPVRVTSDQKEGSGDSLTKTEALDTKSAEVPTTAKMVRLRHVMTMARSGGSKQTDPVEARLVGLYVQSSAAATALNAVQALSPIAVDDFASFAALFDLWRCKSVEVKLRLSGSSAPAGSLSWAVAFDPSNVGVYGGVPDVLTSKFHLGPCVAGIKTLIYPESFTPSGFYDLKAVLPASSRVTNDGAAANAVGGGWVGTSNTTAVVGWMKPFVPSFGPAITSILEYYVIYNCEFKSRT